jgi:hypothetical protein
MEWHEAMKGREYLEYIVVDGRIVLKRILKKYGLEVWIGFM